MSRRSESPYVAKWNPQCGAVLAITLLVLLTMTLLALAASHVTKTQTRVAAAAQEQDQAFQHAEAALRAGERIVLEGEDIPSCTKAPCGIYSAGMLDAEKISGHGIDWWVRFGTAYFAASRTSPALGRFVVEHLAETTDSLAVPPGGVGASTRFYRVTAVGISISGHPRVVLQSVVTKRARQ